MHYRSPVPAHLYKKSHRRRPLDGEKGGPPPSQLIIFIELVFLNRMSVNIIRASKASTIRAGGHIPPPPPPPPPMSVLDNVKRRLSRLLAVCQMLTVQIDCNGLQLGSSYSSRPRRTKGVLWTALFGFMNLIIPAFRAPPILYTFRRRWFRSPKTMSSAPPSAIIDNN